jgi:hypothetical protein
MDSTRHEFNLQHGRKCFDGYGEIDIFGEVTAAMHRIADAILRGADSRGPKKIGAASAAALHRKTWPDCGMAAAVIHRTAAA